VNSQLICDFIAATAPCCILGLLEERRRQCAFLALRPNESNPSDIATGGFNFGHSLLGASQFEVIQFAFHFYGFGTYHVLVNPGNSLVQTVLTSRVEGGDYLFLAIAPDQHVTAFRSKIGQGTPAGLIDNMQRIRGSTTTEIQYQQALTQFRKSPSLPGQVLDWVCRDNGDYLDLTQDRLEMSPTL
jgi:hypothetical protein